MLPGIAIFSMLIVVVLLIGIVQSIKFDFVNQSSRLWIYTLALNWVLSLVIVVCTMRAGKHITAFQQHLLTAYGCSTAESDFLSIRNR